MHNVLEIFELLIYSGFEAVLSWRCWIFPLSLVFLRCDQTSAAVSSQHHCNDRGWFHIKLGYNDVVSG